MFRKQILTILAAVMLFAAANVQAVNKAFTESGQIVDGEVWDEVWIYGNDTVVDMLGGSVLDHISSYDFSTLNMTGGDSLGVYAFDNSIANISSGILYSIGAQDYATVNFSSNAETKGIGAQSFGTVNVTGGAVEHVGASESGTVNLYGGIITDYLGASDFAIVNIYGYGFHYDTLAGNLDGGQLTGFWLDETTFTIDLYGIETYSHINLIPEPNSLLLLLFGSFLLRRNR